MTCTKIAKKTLIKITLFSYASNKEHGPSTGGDWDAVEMNDHINILET